MPGYDKTLLILSPGFAANEADSTCLPAQQQLVLAINKNFPSVNIIILALQYPYVNKPYTWNGNTVIPFGGQNRKRVHRMLLWMQVWKKLKELKTQYTIAGVCCFWYGECTLLGKTFAKKNGLKCFTWILGQDAKPGNRYINLTRPVSGQLVAISDAVVQEFEKNYAVRPAHVIPNAVTPSLFPEHTGERDIDFIGVGSLIPLKRYDLFIELIKQVKQELPQVKAIICGKGGQMDALDRLIQQNDLRENISLPGELPHEQVLQLMQRSKILLHPSSYEGFSGVCLEALYAGAHVISFCNPKNAWIRNWHIVSTNADMITRSLELLKDESTLYRPVLAYDMDDSAKAFMALFQ